MVHKNLQVRTTSDDESIGIHPSPKNPPYTPTDATTMKCVLVQELSQDSNHGGRKSDSRDKIFTFSTSTHIPLIETFSGDTKLMLLEVLSCSLSQSYAAAIEKDMKIKFEGKKGVKVDVCGTIVDVDDEVENFEIGDTVLAMNVRIPMNGITEFIMVEEANAALLPSSVDVVQAAACSGAVTALRAVENLKNGDRVLVLGGDSDVGSTAIQLAKLSGASYIATTSTESQFCLSIGADDVINPYENRVWGIQEFREEKFDKIIDTIGSEKCAPFKIGHILKTGHDGGCLIAIRGGDAKPSLPPWFKVITLQPFLSTKNSPQLTPKCVRFYSDNGGRDLEKVLKLMDEGALKIYLDPSSPLSFSEEGVKTAFQNTQNARRCVLKIS